MDCSGLIDNSESTVELRNKQVVQHHSRVAYFEAILLISKVFYGVL